MAFHTYRIYHYPKDSNGNFVGTGIQLQGVLSVGLTFELDDAADGFSFTINNVVRNEFSDLKIDDRVIIEGSLDGVTYQPLMDGIIQDKRVAPTISSNIITITGLNRLEKLFNAVVNTGGGSSLQPADYWVKNIIDQVNEFNKLGGTNREITYDSSSIQAISASDAIRFDRTYEKGFKLLEELSSPEYTGGKYMYYYLDANNKFYWLERPTGVSEAWDFGEEVTDARITKDMREVVNYVIMNGGKSPYGATILDFGYDVTSISKFGWKVKVVSRDSLASTLKTQDRSSKPNLWSDDSEFPTAYPYTTVWGEVVSNDSEYNTSFVDQVRIALQKEISTFLQNNGGATFEANIRVTPRLISNIGDNYGLVIPSINWLTPEVARVQVINLSFNRDGWRTDIQLAEDNDTTRDGVQ